MSARDRGRGLSVELVERIFAFAMRREQVQLALTCHSFYETSQPFIWRYVRSSRKSSGVLKSMCTQLTRMMRPQLVLAFDVPFTPWEPRQPGYNPVLLVTLCGVLGQLHNLRSLVLNIDKASLVAMLEEQLSNLPTFNHLQSIAIPHDIQFEQFFSRQDAVVAVRLLRSIGGVSVWARGPGRYIQPGTKNPVQYVCGDAATVYKALVPIERQSQSQAYRLELDGVFFRHMATTCEIHIDSPLQGQSVNTCLLTLADTIQNNRDIHRCSIHLSAICLCSLVMQPRRIRLPPPPQNRTTKVIRFRSCICSVCLSAGEGSDLVLRQALSVIYESFDQLEEIELDANPGESEREVAALELKLLSVLSMLFTAFPALKRIRGPLGMIAISAVEADASEARKDRFLLLPKRDFRGTGWFPTRPDW